jgi:hypothetical protein
MDRGHAIVDGQQIEERVRASEEDDGDHGRLVAIELTRELRDTHER